MINKATTYLRYPAGIVLVSNLVSLLIYGLGFYIILKIGLFYSLIFLLYLILFEFRLMRYHCVNCYYWGKTCGFGKGKVSSLFFKHGDPAKFCRAKMTWKDLIPDLLISLVPAVSAIILLTMKYDLKLLLALLFLIALTTAGNGYIRGSLACKYCKQKEIGCPADAFFNKKK
jgi:hypothetical protein